MQSIRLFLVFTVSCFLISCGGKNNNNEPAENDTARINQPDSVAIATATAMDMLATAKPFIDKELGEWIRSFTGFNTDSLRFTHTGSFEQIEYEGAGDMKTFYSLYKASLSYSPDSSQFIDLYSYGLMLEKKGKKIIASADVDNSVTLYNINTKDWKRILFFGPSAGIEEAVWTSASQFILAGMMHNDDGKTAPILLLGDVNTKTFYWFEAKQTRPESSSYESGAMRKLKIDEWE